MVGGPVQHPGLTDAAGALGAVAHGGNGAKGVSVCVVPGPEQSSQGGTAGGFYKSWRVLANDPFFVQAL
jgi:hypothetical protein